MNQLWRPTNLLVTNPPIDQNVLQQKMMKFLLVYLIAISLVWWVLFFCGSLHQSIIIVASVVAMMVK
jgi:hypothetical protein